MKCCLSCLKAQRCNRWQITVEAVTNEPPTHFTEGTLASAMATTGMSVASAARAVEQLQAAGYITDGEDRLTLSESGRVAADYLAASFADLTSSQSRCRTEC